MSTNPRSRAWVEVRADALCRNAARVRAAVGPEVHLVPMVKADAYGLGLREAVRALETERPWGFGVATVDEGVDLREIGVTRPVVVFSPIAPGSEDAAVEAGLQLGVSSLEALDELLAAAARVGRSAAFQVEIDTGMGRAGFDPRTVAEWGPALRRARDAGGEWVGTYTHMHSADETESSVREQWGRLMVALEALGGAKSAGLVHGLNSAGALRVPELAAAAVRPGIFLYGGEVGVGQPLPEPVASVHARVVHARDAAVGDTAGYGATHVAAEPARWATLAIGYGDGFPRALGNRGRALVRGVPVPIIGRISMDVTVVDITRAPEVRRGDVATLIGGDGDERITLDEVATLAGTISYEVLTGLTPRLPRVWEGFDGS
jgi:alanine racemase